MGQKQDNEEEKEMEQKEEKERKKREEIERKKKEQRKDGDLDALSDDDRFDEEEYLKNIEYEQHERKKKEKQKKKKKNNKKHTDYSRKIFVSKRDPAKFDAATLGKVFGDDLTKKEVEDILNIAKK